jgi:opacity protein-like surface antigen
MKRALLSAAAAALLASAAAAQTNTARGGAAAAAPTQVVNRSGSPEDTARIIRAFTQKETEFRNALNNYAFTRDAVIQTIAWGGQISGEYHRTSRFVFDDSGNRFERIVFFPTPTIQEITVTPEDIEDLGGVQAFALEASKINEYDFAYVGKEKIDEVDTYVFDVTPRILSDQKRLAALKKSKSPERYFQGRIWVDDQDYQIVKARGKGVPEFDQRFPTFETYREQIDGKYWFPTYSYADDELTFKEGNTVHVRLRIKYTDFQRLKGKVTVIDEGEPGDVKEEDKKPEPTPVPLPPKPKP